MEVKDNQTLNPTLKLRKTLKKKGKPLPKHRYEFSDKPSGLTTRILPAGLKRIIRVDLLQLKIMSTRESVVIVEGDKVFAVAYAEILGRCEVRPYVQAINGKAKRAMGLITTHSIRIFFQGNEPKVLFKKSPSRKKANGKPRTR